MELNAKVPSGPIEQKWDKHRFELKLVNPANKRRYTIIVVGTGLASPLSIGRGVGTGGSAMPFVKWPLRQQHNPTRCSRGSFKIEV